MESGMNKSLFRNLDYIVLFLLIAFTTFEYFFREESLFWGLAFVCFFIQFNYRRSIAIPNDLKLFCAVLLLTFFVQYIAIDRYKITSVISRSISLFGCVFIARICKERFFKIFVDIVYIISITSLVIYILCILSPTLKEYLIYDVCPRFTSLAVEKAIVEGGGINFIIYNFQIDAIYEDVGLMRNCGPFWEPGMFAVFISLALFINCFVQKCRGKICNVILILSIVSTFSTGGYVAMAFILFVYSLKQGNYLWRVVSFLFFIYILTLYEGLSFVGEKIADQLNIAETGNDLSRFSAILTQIQMINASPIIGGSDLAEFVDTESMTLASGLLMVFVSYGIIIGLFYYYYTYKACKSLTNKAGKWTAIELFSLLLLVSISQTIFGMEFFLLFIILGLLKVRNYGKVQYTHSPVHV